MIQEGKKEEERPQSAQKLPRLEGSGDSDLRRSAQPLRSQSRSAGPSPLMLQHVRMVVSLIEGRRISRRQVLTMLAKNMRQHSLVRRKKIDQAVAWLHETPSMT